MGDTKVTEFNGSQLNGDAGANACAVAGDKDPAVSIIGFGPAGYNAALALRQNGYTGPLRVFSDIDTLPYSPILTSYYAGGEKAYEECFPWSDADIDELDLELKRGCKVERLDVEGHLICTREGEFPYTKCVIATGATPQSFGFPQDCGYNPLMLRTMADAERLKAALCDEGCKDVLVSGASMVALKIAEAAIWRGKNVTIVGMNPHLLDFSALPEAAKRFERCLLTKGVKLRLGQTIKTVAVEEDGDSPLGRKLAVKFSNGETCAYDEIAVAHGMKCNLDFLPEGAIELDHAILVDDFMRTSNPDVYAAGDVAQAREMISGEKRIVGIWRTAVDQGKCAGASIACELAASGIASAADDAAPGSSDASSNAAKPAPYKGSLPANTIAVDGTLFISAGTVDITPDRFVDVRESDDMTVVYVYEVPSDMHMVDVEGDGAISSDRASNAKEGIADAAWMGAQTRDGMRKRLVGFNIACDTDEEGGPAYDIGAMLTMRIERDCTN